MLHLSHINLTLLWSLILPAVEMAEQQNKIAWISAAVGVMLGILFLILVNKTTEKIEEQHGEKNLNMLTFSVTLHNIPEGIFQSRHQVGNA